MAEERTPSKEETETEKNEIINDVASELTEHGLVDLTDFIKQRNKEGFRYNIGFVRSVAYRIEAKGMGEVIPMKEWTEFYVKQSIYSKRNPYRYYLILATFGVVFAGISGAFNACISTLIKPSQPQTIIQQLKQTQAGEYASLPNFDSTLISAKDTTKQ
ncbi:hypothetical protein BH10BAC2_BH10BAC2_48950 [soil metagenome]